MPEFTVIEFFNQEIKLHASDKGQSGLPASDPSEFGRIGVFHDTLARTSGARQSVTIHQPLSTDPLFLPIAKARVVRRKKQATKRKQVTPSHCTRCPTPASGTTILASPDEITAYAHLSNKSAAAILNSLAIEGQLFHAARGKEIVLGVSTFLIRICFGLEAHLLWIRTQDFDEITASKPVSRGAKSKTFVLPPHLFHGPPDTSGSVSIQFYFRRPSWTLIALDHNVMITFHVMRLRRACIQADFEPSSAIWPYLWSSTHGPVHHLEPDAAQAALADWRAKILDDGDMTMVFVAVKGNQVANNGYGAQETTDMLWEARLHPCMPIYFIARSDSLWARFIATHRSYQVGRLEMLKTTQLARVSGKGAFHFNQDSHNRFLRTISIYRRADVRLDRQPFLDLVESNLLNPHATLQDDGTAVVLPVNTTVNPFYRPGLEPPVPDGHMRSDVHRRKISIFRLAVPPVVGSSESVNVYTPITAQIPSSWDADITSFLTMAVSEDVSKVKHKTTLGPYSFDVFVSAVWSATRIENLPRGKRVEEVFGQSVRKRPRASSIRKGQENMEIEKALKKKRLCLLFKSPRVPKGDEDLQEADSEDDSDSDLEYEPEDFNE